MTSMAHVHQLENWRFAKASFASKPDNFVCFSKKKEWSYYKRFKKNAGFVVQMRKFVFSKPVCLKTNPNPRLPLQIFVLNFDWFDAIPIQFLSFCDSAKRKCASDAWQILYLVVVSWKSNSQNEKFCFKNNSFHCVW